jgi:exodeoxyribonuclease V gamma subunit
VGRLRTQDLLDIWLHHLALNVLRPTGVLRATQVIGLHERRAFAPVADAAALLDDLVDLHGAGGSEPLPLFPESSHAFVAARRSGKGGEIARARSAWVGSDHHRGEGDDAYMALAFRGADPISDPRFAALAERVFGPLLEALGA